MKSALAQRIEIRARQIAAATPGTFVYLGSTCPVRPFEKDCGCLDSIHPVGPCWLHTDGILRELNLRLLERSDAMAIHAFAEAEYARLHDKYIIMKGSNLDYIPEQFQRLDLDKRQHELVAVWLARIQAALAVKAARETLVECSK